MASDEEKHYIEFRETDERIRFISMWSKKKLKMMVAALLSWTQRFMGHRETFFSRFIGVHEATMMIIKNIIITSKRKKNTFHLVS